MAPHATSTMAGRYVPLNPVRITDTRSGSKLPNAGKTLGNADTLNIQVAGSGGVPSADVSAAVLNVTVVGPTSASALTVFPEGMARPVVVNLNFSASETLANLVTVPLGDGGGVTIFNQAGRADVLVDLEGYYTNSPRSSGLYNQVNPFRVMGSLVAGVTVGPGTSTAVTVAGVGGVPDQVSAVVVNVTVAGSTDPGYLTVFPAPFSGLPSPPRASNLSYAAGQMIANRVIVPVGANGLIEVYNSTGSVQLDVDLDGYYTGSAGQLGSAFTPLAPTRLTDTRVGANGSTISANSTESFNFLGDNISPTATALVSNVTVISRAAAGFVTIYPVYESSPPTASDMDFMPNSISQAFALAPLNGAATKIFDGGVVPIDVVIDAFGYFAPPPPAVIVVASPMSVPANGESTSVLTVTVITGSGVAYDDNVTLTLSSSVFGSCGSNGLAGSTNASGQVATTYTASTTPGSCTITATEADGSTTGSTTITQTGPSQPAPPPTNVVRLNCAVPHEPVSISAVPRMVVCCVVGPLGRRCAAVRRR